ncbi:hypothetical protein [Candidatus Neptunichlamydia sp. REUL1]|uniref:hypothetical protein n=1 Tax=Candidatus Neptunichlamydia sp. REUL1 TaxID=3064277 RepID=UPI0029300C3F|nr:hypothetical protein [Candidatus Neptunochlamydia sp. REUL1]
MSQDISPPIKPLKEPPLELIVKASEELEKFQSDNEAIDAKTTSQLADALKIIYDNASDILKQDSDKVQKDSSPDDANKDENKYNCDNQKFQNIENVANNNVQSMQTSSQQLAQSQQMTIQFASDATELLKYTGNLLQGQLG